MSIVLSMSALSTIALGGSTAQSTLAFVTLALGVAIAAFYTPRLIATFGYKQVFVTANAACIVAGSLAVFAVHAHHLTALFFSTFAFGVFQGAANYYRFAASDLDTQRFTQATRLYLVLASGLIAAVVGPTLVASTAHNRDYGLAAFPYVTVCGLGLLGTTLAAALNIVVGERTNESRHGHSPSTTDMYRYMFGCVSTLLGYLAMTAVMTAGPIASKNLHGNTSHVPHTMQLHFVAMFGPMLLLPSISKKIGKTATVFTGAAIGIVGSLYSATHPSHFAMLAAMICAGISWAFIYGSASAILAESVDTVTGATFRGIGELFPALGLAAGSLIAGPVMEEHGWPGVNIVAIAALSATILFVPFSRQRHRAERSRHA